MSYVSGSSSTASTACCRDLTHGGSITSYPVCVNLIKVCTIMVWMDACETASVCLMIHSRSCMYSHALWFSSQRTTCKGRCLESNTIVRPCSVNTAQETVWQVTRPNYRELFLSVSEQSALFILETHQRLLKLWRCWHCNPAGGKLKQARWTCMGCIKTFPLIVWGLLRK